MCIILEPGINGVDRIFAQTNKQGGWRFCLKLINWMDGNIFLKILKLVTLLLTVPL